MAARPPQYNREHAAAILAEAFLTGKTKETCEKHGVAVRTLYYWKKRLEPTSALYDEALAAAYERKRDILERDWADGLVPAIREFIDFLRRAAKPEGLDPKNFESVKAATTALRTLTDVALAKRLVDARLPSSPRSPRAEAREVPLGRAADAPRDSGELPRTH